MSGGDLEFVFRMRRLIGTEQLLLPSTACILLDAAHRVLLQRRSDSGLWGCPGGILDTGETVLDNAVREVQEETGLAIQHPMLFGIYSGPGYEYTYPNGDRTSIVQFVVLSRSWTGTPLHDHESLELDFFQLDAMPATITPPHLEFLAHLRAYLKGDLELPVVF